jgi:hypothetical protein
MGLTDNVNFKRESSPLRLVASEIAGMSVLFIIIHIKNKALKRGHRINDHININNDHNNNEI